MLNKILDCLVTYRGLVYELAAFSGLLTLILLNLKKGIKKSRLFKKVGVYIAISITLLLAAEGISTIKAGRVDADFQPDEKVITEFAQAVAGDKGDAEEKIREIIYRSDLSVYFEVDFCQDSSEASQLYAALTEQYKSPVTTAYDDIDVCFSGCCYDKTSLLVPVEPSEWRSQLIIRAGACVLRFSEAEARKSQCDIMEKLKVILSQYNAVLAQ